MRSWQSAYNASKPDNDVGFMGPKIVTSAIVPQWFRSAGLVDGFVSFSSLHPRFSSNSVIRQHSFCPLGLIRIQCGSYSLKTSTSLSMIASSYSCLQHRLRTWATHTKTEKATVLRSGERIFNIFAVTVWDLNSEAEEL